MKEIVRQYGMAILTAVVVTGILLLLLRKMDFFSVLGNGAAADMVEINETASEAAAASVMKRAVPRALSAANLVAGRKYRAQELISVVDADKRAAHLRIQKLCFGEDEILPDEEQNYILPQAGTYRAKIAIWDDAGAGTSGWIYVNVNEE